MQFGLFKTYDKTAVEPPRGQLLKWIGNKQRFAAAIVSQFPGKFGRYFEPFLGSGAILSTLSPSDGLGSDAFRPLIEIWQTLVRDPESVKSWYGERWDRLQHMDKVSVYEQIKLNYNKNPNGPDLLFLCRSCYGGVVRFRQSDKYMSTPCGIHRPISPKAFNDRVDEWHWRIKDCCFEVLDYREAMNLAKEGDLIYCDPPYHHSQSILYGAQAFDLSELLRVISECKKRGVFVGLSIDGTKKSGSLFCELPVPDNLFEREVYVNCGRSMLRRFQMNGKTLESEDVADRLLLTF
jgi:DNA adenine methylase